VQNMNSDEASVQDPKCKCCGSDAQIIGFIDFNKSCMDKPNARIFPPSDLNIPYWCCSCCGFIFTNHMDSWSSNDFKNQIYNSEYILVDPPIPGRKDVPIRETPSYLKGLFIASMVEGSENEISILDFGSGGNPGPTGLALIESGFKLHSYDPYRGSRSEDLRDKFDLIIAVEVMEHCHNLAEVALFMNKYLGDNGVLWIETALHAHPAPSNVLESWYISPRNGHISIFTAWALTFLFKDYGINIVQTPYAILGFKKLPNFSNKMFI